MGFWGVYGTFEFGYFYGLILYTCIGANAGHAQSGLFDKACRTVASKKSGSGIRGESGERAEGAGE